MTGLIVLIVVVFVGIFVAAWYFGERQRILRTLRQTPTATVGEATSGAIVRITGNVSFHQPALTAPLTGRRCAYYHVTVEQETRDSKGHTHWHEVLEERSGVQFVISDATGKAIVDPTGGKITLAFDGYSRSGTLDDATPQEEAILQRHGKKSQGWLFNKKLRYQEAVIEEGELVMVVARIMMSPDPSVARIFLGGDHDAPLYLTDETSKV